MHFPFSYSLGNDIVKEFIEPELDGATKYYRSTGHFSSSFLISAAEAFATFFETRKEMKVICCAELKEKDLECIQKGQDVEEVIENSILDSLKELPEKIEYMRTNNIQTLYWLIKTGQLEIKTCVMKSDMGLFHEKYGLIYRPDRNACFIGGFNLSLSGHLVNSEACHGFIDEPNTFEIYEKAFLTTWNGQSPIADCYGFPEAAKHIIVKEFEKEWERRVHRPIDEDPPIFGEMIFDSLWDHQKNGFNRFFETGCHGIVQMATGTGKTKMALAIYQELYQKNDVKNCILVGPRKPLLNQWIKDIGEYFPEHNIIRRYGDYNELADLLDYVDDGYPVFLLTTYGLYKDVEKSARQIRENTLIICDEVHNLGADTCERDLKGRISQIKYRLGLSATPERIYDEDGTTFIQGEVGPVIYEYTLPQALADGILCPFRYAPIEYSLTEMERNRVKELVKKRYAKDPDGKPIMSESDFRRLISDVFKRSLQKIGPFQSFLSNHPTMLERSVIFVFDKKYGMEVQNAIQKFDNDFEYHTFYDDDDDDFLDQFSNKELRCLITCNKISEGISINDITTVILFSAAKSPTETLQRIGRCLRVNPKDKNKIALIVDFIERDRVLKDSADKDRYDYLSSLCKEMI